MGALPEDGLATLGVPAITPRSTRKSPERMLAHKAKMDGKKYDRDRRYNSPNHGVKITVMSRTEIRRRFGPSFARVNRHTGKPHEHAQEIMRNTMNPIARRAFRERVAASLALPSVPEDAPLYEISGPLSDGRMLFATNMVSA